MVGEASWSVSDTGQLGRRRLDGWLGMSIILRLLLKDSDGAVQLVGE